MTQAPPPPDDDRPRGPRRGWLSRFGARIARVVGRHDAARATEILGPPGPVVDLGDAVGVWIRRPGHDAVLFDSHHPAEVRSLEPLLRTLPPHGAVCACAGTLVFEFIGGRPAIITLHHGTSLRWAGSPGNVDLTPASAAGLRDWLAARGMAFVRDEYLAAEARADADGLAHARWVAAMPAALRPLLAPVGDVFALQPAWIEALERAEPDVVRRADVLLTWYGQGLGPWSGYPSRETAAALLLDALPRNALVIALPVPSTADGAVGALRLLVRSSRRLVERLPDGAIAALVTRAAERLTDDHRQQVELLARALAKRARLRSLNHARVAERRAEADDRSPGSGPERTPPDAGRRS